MKNSKLIEHLQRFPMDAEVRLNDKNGYPCLFVLAVQGDEKNVWLECEADCDLGEELGVRFETAVNEQLDETDFYSELLDMGITIETVRKYMGDECADHMKSYCEEHGLLDGVKFIQLCVWQATELGEQKPEEFEKFIMETFGCRAKFCEEVHTLPDKDENGKDVDGTGGRADLFFYIADEDIKKFAVPRLQYGIRWWEDVLSNGQGVLYPKEILDKYPAKW